MQEVTVSVLAPDQQKQALDKQEKALRFSMRKQRGGHLKPLALSKLFVKVLYTHPWHFGKRKHGINTACVMTFVQDK